MGFSYSKVETHHSCPYKFYLRYIQKLEAKPDMSPNNALFLGSALHEGIEKRSVDEAINKYKSYFEEIGLMNSIIGLKSYDPSFCLASS